MELGSSDFIVFGRLSERQIGLLLQKFLRERRSAVKKDRQEWMQDAMKSIREMATARLCSLPDAAMILFPRLQPNGPTLEQDVETDSDSSGDGTDDEEAHPITGEGALAKWTAALQ